MDWLAALKYPYWFRVISFTILQSFVCPNFKVSGMMWNVFMSSVYMNVLKYHLQWQLGHLQREVKSIQITTTHGTPTTTMTTKVF